MALPYHAHIPELDLTLCDDFCHPCLAIWGCQYAGAQVFELHFSSSGNANRDRGDGILDVCEIVIRKTEGRPQMQHACGSKSSRW